MSAPTPQQLAAINARGNVLVAAGAGTGKTSTITQRCVRLVIEEGCRLDQILMVTFTEAAATEMRDRIRKALRERLADESADSDTASRLAGEIALLDTAPISTLHSFCLELVRRNFHALGLDPQFSVLDEQQTKPLIHSVLDELFERHYANAAENSNNVRELVRLYGNGHDESIRQLVVKLHQHTQALALPEQWFEKQIAMFSEPSATVWRTAFVTGVIEWSHLWRDVLASSAETSLNVADCLNALVSLPTSVATFEQAAAVLDKIVAADAAEWERGTKTKIRKPIEPFFNDAAFLHELTHDKGAPLAQDWSWVREYMLTLLQLAREFTEDFSKAKRELGGIDFADQEQLALRLLYDGTGKPTPVALACRERFRFVFVDECQDINAAQDAILRAVGRASFGVPPLGGSLPEPPKGGTPNGGNRFLVGDVKQSIYRFRLADPRIFQDYESRWKQANADGQCLPLSENFRSREALLTFINPLFRTLMRPVIGGLNYDADSELQFGNPTERVDLSLAANIPKHEISPRVELHIITKESESDSNEDNPGGNGRFAELADLQTTEREARLVASRLKELKVSGHRIWNPKRKQFEAVEYRDMVVLMRSVAGRAEIYAKAFHQIDVPLHAERAGFLDAIEVADLLNLLRLLDNPLQDVPLLAVLRSPLVGFSADELVQMRLAQRNGLLWFALRKLGESKDSSALTAKANWFLDRWKVWRELIRHSSLSHCIETALAETHYEALLLAGERGSARVANIRRLVEMARRFDPFQREGLFRFLQFIAEQEAAEVRHEPAALDHENAVRLMTIHSSKGLEFPVVVVAGLGGKFNMRDLSNDILLNEDLGLCPKVLPPESRRRYPSIAHWVATQGERRALLGEEMRLLYVALTRARDTLILTGTATKKDEIARWRESVPVTDYALVKATGCMDWLRLWFGQQTKPDEWSSDREGNNSLLRWQFHDLNDAGFLSAARQEKRIDLDLKTPTAIELSSIKGVLQWHYRQEAATLEPAKTSVSVLRRRAADEVDGEAKQLFQPKRLAKTFATSIRMSGKLSAAQIGTAHHTFMQFVSLERTASELDLRNEAARLEQAGALTAEEIAALDFAALTHFWQSPLGLNLRQTPEKTVQREMPFTARMSAADFRQLKLPLANPGLADDEFVVVQGVVDLAVIQPKEIWLLDFKTDDFSASELQERTELYAPQLKLYALALSRIYGRSVTQCCLHFLAQNKIVSVTP